MQAKGKGRSLAHGLAILAIAAPFGLQAADLPAGTEINSGNWEQMRTQTFEGKAIESMVPESIQMAVRDYGLKITLKNSEPATLAKHIMDATTQHAPQVQYDPATRHVSGWVAGIPFPDGEAILNAPPEQGGDMALYNVALFGAIVADNTNCYGPYATLQIDPSKGVERTQGGFAMYFRTKGRTTGGPTQVGDDPHLRKIQVIVFDSPYDIAGLGVYRRIYDDGRVDDIYAYVKSVRRIRRLSGGSWMDTLAGTDILNDDTYSFEGHPTWYPRNELKGKRWILWPMNSPPIGQHDLDEVVDYKNPPYWNPINKSWEPREVYVVEVTTPEGHPYGKKVIYVDAQVPAALLTEAYTRSGELWRIIYSMLGPEPPKAGEGGPAAYQLSNFGAWDFRRSHGNYMDCGRWDTNAPLRLDDVTPRLLVESAGGKRMGQTPQFGKGP
ncbi:MAG: DUF1329 domain-containing protein [Pseudomonadota bacterium]